MKADLVIRNGTVVTPVMAIVHGHVQMEDGEPVGEAVGRMVYPVPD